MGETCKDTEMLESVFSEHSEVESAEDHGAEDDMCVSPSVMEDASSYVRSLHGRIYYLLAWAGLGIVAGGS